MIPAGVSSLTALARSPALTLMTRERVVTATAVATADDVATGRANTAGEAIQKTRRIEPVAVYFEEGVVRVDPNDAGSPKTGAGLFRVEVYLLALLGFDVAGFSPAQLLTTRYVVDALLPILLLIVVSLLTPPTDPVRVARFYARMKTPVAPSLAEDAVEVEASYANPTRYDHQKLFPNSNWELTKWNRQDTLGFLACCALVGVVLLVFKGVLVVGR